MKKIILGFLLGVLITETIGVIATNTISSSIVSYNNTTVNHSLDELYSLAYNKVYDNGTAVYYNPVTNKKCISSESKSLTGTKTGCMKWYTFNDGGSDSDVVNLILDHNTTAAVSWNSDANNSYMKDAALSLVNDTKEWKVGARLITAYEIATIIGETNFKGTSAFYLTGSLMSGKGTSKYAWLYDYTYNCESYGGNINDKNEYNNNYVTGYWTSTPNNSNRVNTFYVSYFGQVDFQVDNSRADMGIRPVITISKSILS